MAETREENGNEPGGGEGKQLEEWNPRGVLGLGSSAYKEGEASIHVGRRRRRCSPPAVRGTPAGTSPAWKGEGRGASDGDPTAGVSPCVPLRWTGPTGLWGEGSGGLGLKEKERKEKRAQAIFPFNKTE